MKIYCSGIGGIGTFYEEMKGFFAGDGTPRFNPFFIPKMISDIASGHISMKYGFRGPNYCTVSACASSSHALIDASHFIRLGKADVLIVGGSEASITEVAIGAFGAIKALSERNDDPKTASRPFDLERDGFVMGEGSGCMILESLEHAQKRHAKIYAEVVGAAVTSDAHHITAPDPEGTAAASTRFNTLQLSGVKSSRLFDTKLHGQGPGEFESRRRSSTQHANT